MHTHTHRQTDGSVFITSTADAGGNEPLLRLVIQLRAGRNQTQHLQPFLFYVLVHFRERGEYVGWQCCIDISWWDCNNPCHIHHQLWTYYR